ncbi:MAG: hypothetical protein ACP5I8_15375 [Phycisphaerae bacterium]
MSDIIIPSGGDDAARIQAAIEVAVSRDGLVRLGRGVFLVGRTISIAKCHGLRVEGVGACNPKNCGPGWSDIRRALGTCLQWVGQRGGTMLEILASPDISLNRMEFDGNSRAGVLAQISTVHGWSSTETHISNAVFRKAAVGIRLGEPARPNGGNNDVCTFESLQLACDIGVQICNDQSLCHRFSLIDNYSRIGIDIRQGGCVTVDRFIQSGSDGNRVGVAFFGGGVNAATLSLTNARLEGGCLLTCGGSNQVVHVASYCGDAGGAVLPWKIGPSALVTAQACSFSGPVAELSGLPGRKAVLIIQNSLLAKPAGQSIVYKNAHAYAAVEGVCIQWTNAPA